MEEEVSINVSKLRVVPLTFPLILPLSEIRNDPLFGGKEQKTESPEQRNEHLQKESKSKKETTIIHIIH